MSQLYRRPAKPFPSSNHTSSADYWSFAAQDSPEAFMQTQHTAIQRTFVAYRSGWTIFSRYISGGEDRERGICDQKLRPIKFVSCKTDHFIPGYSEERGTCTNFAGFQH